MSAETQLDLSSNASLQTLALKNTVVVQSTRNKSVPPPLQSATSHPFFCFFVQISDVRVLSIHRSVFKIADSLQLKLVQSFEIKKVTLHSPLLPFCLRLTSSLPLFCCWVQGDALAVSGALDKNQNPVIVRTAFAQRTV